MIKNQKMIFLYALIITLVVFNLGIFMGYMLESSRLDRINILYSNAELELFDQMAQKESLGALNINCKTLVEENIKFGDKVFQEALQIQKYEEANRISGDIIFQHKRFDLLRTLFWMNSIKIKQSCNSNYHNIVYFYKYNNPSINQDSKQKFFSNLLEQVKKKEGDKVMLIPIAGDNDIPSINILINQFNITEFPTILIDEKTKLTDIKNADELENFFK
ncbi:MAG: hypothetical protein AABX99_00810 [Nanoarchaeota archaeon]